MRKLGKKGTKALKVFHFLFAIMWIGGVMALVSIQLSTVPVTAEMAYMAATDQLIIDEFFLIPGGIGIVVTAVAYGVFTGFGFFRQLWLKVKWALTVLLVAIGAGYMGVIVKENVRYAEQALANGNMDFSIYWSNVYSVAVAGIIQLVFFLIIILLSVTKPKKRTVDVTNGEKS